MIVLQEPLTLTLVLSYLEKSSMWNLLRGVVAAMNHVAPDSGRQECLLTQGMRTWHHEYHLRGTGAFVLDAEA